VKFQQKITQAVDAAPSRSYRPASCGAVLKTRTAQMIIFFPALSATKSLVQHGSGFEVRDGEYKICQKGNP
jgi:hypothetical protein